MLIVFGGTHERAGLEETAGVHHLVDAFADRVAPAFVLALDAVRPTHLLRQFLDEGDVVNRLLPRHAGLPSFVFAVDGHGVGLPSLRSGGCRA